MPAVLFAPLTRTYVTQKFGVNPGWYKRYGCKGHNGIDFRTKFSDTPLGHRHVRSMAGGVVIEVGDQGKLDYGRFIRVRHDDGSQTVYAHLLKAYVKVGQRVFRPSLAEGTIIGLTDNTGRSTASHLHAAYRPPNWSKTYGNGFLGYVNFWSMLVV